MVRMTSGIVAVDLVNEAMSFLRIYTAQDGIEFCFHAVIALL